MSPPAQEAPDLRADDSAIETGAAEGVTMVEVRGGVRLALASPSFVQKWDKAPPEADRIRRAFKPEQIGALLEYLLCCPPTLLLLPYYGDSPENSQRTFAKLIGNMRDRTNSHRVSVNSFFGPTESYTLQGHPIVGWQPVLMDGRSRTDHGRYHIRHGRPRTDFDEIGSTNPWDGSGSPFLERLKKWRDFLRKNPLLGGMDRRSCAAFLLDGLERENPPDADGRHCTVLDQDQILESGQHIPLGYYDADQDRPIFRWSAPGDVPRHAQFRLAIRGEICS